MDVPAILPCNYASKEKLNLFQGIEHLLSWILLPIWSASTCFPPEL